MSLKDALELALKILKQVMEEKLNSSNVEVSKIYLSVFMFVYYPVYEEFLRLFFRKHNHLK